MHSEEGNSSQPPSLGSSKSGNRKGPPKSAAHAIATACPDAGKPWSSQEELAKNFHICNRALQ